MEFARPDSARNARIPSDLCYGPRLEDKWAELVEDTIHFVVPGRSREKDIEVDKRVNDTRLP
jgi:hypothetical protein